jgi:hypothetical protein
MTDEEVGFTINVPFALPPEVTTCCVVEVPVTNEWSSVIDTRKVSDDVPRFTIS